MPDATHLLYAAPAADSARHEPGGDELDDLVAKTKASPLVVTAAGVAALTGTILALSAVQLWINFTLFGTIVAVPWGMIALGLGHFAIAVKIFRLRLWAAQAGGALGIVTSLAAFAWLVLAAASGLFTLYGMVLPLLGIATAVLSFLALAPCRRGTDARRRLDKDGLHTDF
jgi:hypothetical protein